ncbi:hypothetical protein quinque_016520, partial [Culex quinquefasciatus]
MGGQLLLSYSTLFCATCLDAPEYVDGLWDYGGRIHRSAWFPASVGITAGEAGVLSRDGWSADQNGGVARAVPTPERCRGRSSCVSDRARRYDVPRGNTAGVGWLMADGCVCAGLYAKRTNTEGFCGHNGTEISDGGGRLDGDRSGKQRYLPGCPQINAGSSCLRPDLQIV